jgi:hypothetical protein
MSGMDRWDIISEVIRRFYEVNKVSLVLVEASKNGVCVYIMVNRNKDDEKLKDDLLKVEKGILKDFSELSLSFNYNSIEEIRK